EQGYDTHADGLVHQFQATAAGYHGKAVAHILVRAQQGADQLVQGVMTTDIFPAYQHVALPIDKGGGVQPATVPGQLLRCIHALTQVLQVRNIRESGRYQRCEGWQGLLQRLYPAQAATTGSRHLPAVLLEVPEGATADLDIRMPAVALYLLQLQVIQLIDVLDNAVGAAEAHHE